MKRRLLFLTIVLAAPRSALACPVCFGQTDSPLASAMNLGIVVMLVVVVAVLACFAAFMVHLNRRGRLADAVAPGSRPTHLGSTNPQEGTAQC